jgi:hypothetical protein
MANWKENKGEGPWDFVQQGDKPHYNEGDLISSSPLVTGGSPVWDMAENKIGDTPITSIHNPWCGYWTKGLTSALVPDVVIQITQDVVEVIRLGDPYLRLGQDVVEIIRLGDPSLNMSQHVIEVIRSSA